MTENKQLEQQKQAKRGKAKARGNGQGSIAQLPSGSWHWEIRLNGQRYGGTTANKTAAANELSRVKTDFARGVLASADKTTFEDYAKKWLERHKHISANTRRMYLHDLGYTFKIIGEMKVKDIRPTHLKAMLETLSNQIMKAGKGKGKTMSTRTLGMVRARVRSIFGEAVQDQIIYVNPADAVRRIKSGKHTEDFEGTALDFDQAARFHELGEALYLSGSCVLWCALFLAAALGLRRGEVMGLRWKDIDFENNVLSVRQNLTANPEPTITTPKTKNSIRDIPMPSSVRAMLKAHQEKQEQNRAKAGNAWENTGAVFATELGAYTHPDNLSRALNGVLDWSTSEPLERKTRENKVTGEKPTIKLVTLEQRMKAIPREHRAKLEAIIYAGKPLPKISPHDLRHTAATLMLRRGMPVEVVSKILGHARVSITMDTYRHVLESEKKAVMVDLFEQPFPVRNVAIIPLN
jgi:integrase